MTINEQVRQRAIEILRNPRAYSDIEVHNAVIDLRRNPKRGDEELLAPLLEHHDPMVAAAALYALTRIYGRVEDYRDLIMKLAQGDPRDCMEMPLQSTAIERLTDLVQAGDQEALHLLWEIAENPLTDVCAQLTAWACLARLAGDEWSFSKFDRNSEIMIQNPYSEEAEQIRHEVRETAKKNGIYIKPE